MGQCTKIVHIMPPFKNFGMSTKRIFDDTYLYLREVNQKFQDKAHHHIDELNGMPAQSYYEISSQYWNLIYN